MGIGHYAHNLEGDRHRALGLQTYTVCRAMRSPCRASAIALSVVTLNMRPTSEDDWLPLPTPKAAILRVPLTG